MTVSLLTRGYGALSSTALWLARPRRLAGPAPRPLDRPWAGLVVVIVGVLFFAGTMLIEAARLRGP